MASNQFLKEELDTPLLDELYPHLWVVARRSGDHIDPLHVHILRGRKIVIAEDPEMHLTWGPQVVYVKPIPESLLDETMWQDYFAHTDSTSDIQKSNCTAFDTTQLDRFPSSDIIPLLIGFLRSYSLLIRRQSDLRLAQTEGLLPHEWTWKRWSAFACLFHRIDDSEVVKRYHYGQLRLSRLNWAVRIHNPKHAKTRWYFHVPFWSIGQYLRVIVVPIAFIYTSLSIILAAMQVMATGNGFAPSLNSSQSQDTAVVTAQNVFWIFCIIVLVTLVLVWILFTLIPIIILIWQLQYGFRHRLKKNDAADSVEV